MDAWVQDDARALRRILDARDAYGVFELWEGCGKELVRDTFYQYVKDFHPDRFGAADAATKQLAEEAFIRINSSYTQLLSKENEQRVAPPHSTPAAANTPSAPSAPSAPSFDAPQPARVAERPIVHTPTATPASTDARAAKLARLRASSTTPTPPTPTPLTSLAEESSTAEEDRAAKLARLAGRRKRPSAEELIGQINSIRQPETSEATEAPVEEDRRAKLARLAQKSRGNMLIVEDDDDDDIPLADASNSSVGHIPQQVLAQALRGVDLDDDVTSRQPRDLFNEAYKDFKLKRYEQALRLFRAAHEREPADGLYMTFFGYCLFLVHPDQIQLAEDKLKAAIETEHRQALPDAHLFLGYILEKQGKSARALRHFERAHQLNPASRDAERQLRLYQMRQAREHEDNPNDLISKLFKK